MKKLILASGSPRRIEIMKSHKFNPIVIPSDIEEHIPSFLLPCEATMFLAFSKAMSVKEKCKEAALIIGADTIVVFDGKILGKPKDEDNALDMLLSMSGKKHQVITGVAIVNSISNNHRCFYETTDVYFKKLPENEIKAYVKTSEPYDKAGGYGIQGTFAKYTDHFKGDLNNVIGFPWNRFVYEKNLL